MRVAVASHNLRSVAHAIAYNRLTGGDDGDLELQVLRGLGDELQDALAAGGLRVRTYCPVGDLVAGMAYLVRRLLENTSNESFLPASRPAARAARAELPRRADDARPVRQRARCSSCAARPCARSSPRRWPALDARLPLRVPVWIGDERRDGEELVSTDPGRPDRVVARRPRARRRGRRRRGRGARAGCARLGRARPADARRRCWSRAAARLRERRLELAALAVRECAKPWPEADADVCEAIDFLEYYARGGDRAGARAPSCSRCPASATRCATCRAASPR